MLATKNTKRHKKSREGSSSLSIGMAMIQGDDPIRIAVHSVDVLIG